MKNNRGQRPRIAEIASFNSSGKPQLQGALRFLAKKRSDGIQVAAVCNQEHQMAGEAFSNLKLHSKQRGWRLLGAEALATDG